MKKRILIDGTPILGASGTRGIGRMACDLLLGLESLRDEWQRDLDVRVITDLAWNGGTVHASPGAAAELLFAARGREGKPFIRKRRHVLDGVAAQEGADLLHLVEAIGVPLTRKVPRMVTCHDLIPLRMPYEVNGFWPRRLLQKPADAWRYRSAERVVAISRKTARDVEGLLDIDPAKIDVVPNGIDLGQWTSQPLPTDGERLRALGLGSRPFVLYVGWCDTRKDVPAMLRAVEAADVQLVWVGKLNEWDHRRIRLHLLRTGVSPSRVHFTGFASTPDLAVLYRHALAHLFLSRLEGFGLSVAEAMASGCPVILARDSGADEVGGEAAFAVEQGDWRAASDAIRRLRDDPSERTRRHDAAVARARTFGREEMARGYLAAWRRGLGQGA